MSSASHESSLSAPSGLSEAGGAPLSSSAGKVLVVDDSAANRELLRRTLEPEGFDAFLVPSGELAIQVARKVKPTLILMDLRMPGGLDGLETCARLKEDPATASIPVIFITVDNDKKKILEAFDVGGIDYITKPFNEREVIARVRSQARIQLLRDELLRKNAELEAEIDRRKKVELDLDRAGQRLDAISQQELARWGLASFVGQSPAMARIVEDIRKIQATTTTSILILGESGTGKELIARAIHFSGNRSNGPFLVMNCSAIPSELAESMLFGHVAGAFTGAKNEQKGWFEMAHGGSLFLDEIGDMPLALQSKVLRVLEDGLVTPVGGSQPRQVSVRVIAATHRELPREIQLGHFRQDLYFRLARFIVRSPALRDREGDIPLLVEHFVKSLAAEMGMPKPGITIEALEILKKYHFPGNVRELKNIVEHGLIRSGGFIEARDLPSLEPPGLRPLLEMREKDEWTTPSFGAGLAELKRNSSRRSEKSSEEQIELFLQKFSSMSNADCCELLDIPADRAYSFLNRLVQAGKLKRTGERRWTRYQLNS